jgi:hypothetical protein
MNSIKSNPFYLDTNVRQLIDETGEVPMGMEKEKDAAIAAATAIAKRMLGGTLVIKGRSFILANLELYYGGIGDLAHDWHRSRFQSKNSGISVLERTSAQEELGLRLYVSSKGGNYKRADIVIGAKGVAVSLLIRNIADVNGNLLAPRKIGGNPNIILREEFMNLSDSDHDSLLGEFGSYQFKDTHDQYVSDDSQIVMNKRFNQNSFRGFEDSRFGQMEWSFSVEGLFKPCVQVK